MEPLAAFPQYLTDEIIALATKHHFPDILADFPSMNDSDRMGTLQFLWRIDTDADHIAC